MFLLPVTALTGGTVQRFTVLEIILGKLFKLIGHSHSHLITDG
jgi:hypothetical protein